MKSDISLGDKIEDAMDGFSNGVRFDITSRATTYSPINNKRSSTIPMPASDNIQPIIIPPQTRVPMLQAANTPNKGLQTIDMENDFVKCNICNVRVNVPYLDQHLKVHVDTYEPKNSFSGSSSTSNKNSTALVRVPNIIVPSNSNAQQNVSPVPPKLNAIEGFKYRKIEAAAIAASVSQSGRYSDFTIVFWDMEKLFVNNTTYAGSSQSSTSKDWERLSIHIVYDSKEDYYTISTKLLKRASYSTWDSEDAIVDQICYQDEILKTIKRSLLFFRMSPRTAYKLFLKAVRGDINIDYDANGKAVIAQTIGSNDLSERLKKPATGSYPNYASGYHAGMYGSCD